VEPDYLPNSEVFFSRVWIPFPEGGVGGIPPPQYLTPGGRNFGAPPWQGFGGNAPKDNFLGKFPCKIL
jgi:hypothetical protein